MNKIRPGAIVKGTRIKISGVIVEVVRRRNPSGAVPCYKIFFKDCGNGLPREVRGNNIVTYEDVVLWPQDEIEAAS